MEIIFQNDSYFTGTWTYLIRLPIPKYAVAETPYFWCKADNCDTCTEIVNNVLLYLVPDTELMLTRCQKWMLQNHCIPHDVCLL